MQRERVREGESASRSMTDREKRNRERGERRGEKVKRKCGEETEGRRELKRAGERSEEE